jgi:hypothetical protein
LHGLAPFGEESIAHLNTAVERVDVARASRPSGVIPMWENVIPSENIEPYRFECPQTIQNEHHLLLIHEGT